MTDLTTSLAPPGRQPLRDARTEQAFTLIELLIVIAVLGVLMTLATVAWKEAKVRAYDAQALICARGIKTAEAIHYNDTRTFATFDNLAGADIGACKVVFSNAGLNSGQVVVQLPGSMLAAVSQTAEVLQAPFMARAENAATTTAAPTAPVGNATDTSYAYTVLHPSGRTTFLASETYLGPIAGASSADTALASPGPSAPASVADRATCISLGGSWYDTTRLGVTYGCDANTPPICTSIGGFWRAGNCDTKTICQYYITLWNPPEGCGASNGIGIALYNNLNPSGDNAEVPSTVKVTDGVHQLNYNNIGAFPLNINYGGSYGSIGHWAGATDGPVRVEVTYPAQSDGMDNTLSVGSALLHQAGDFNAGLPGTVVSPSVTTTQDGSDKTTVITFASFHGSDRVHLNLDTLRN